MWCRTFRECDGEQECEYEPMIIPHDQLSPPALEGVIREFVTRDGTEHTDVADKVAQVRRQLDAGTIVIVFDDKARTCGIVPADEAGER